MLIHVHVMSINTAAGAHALRERELLPQLHPREQARYRAFKHIRRRQTWLAGRALLLAMLKHHLQTVDMSALQTDIQGAIRYRDGCVHVSLSHSRDMLVAVLSGTSVGVDIEWPRPRACVAQAQQLFTDFEAQYLCGLPASERQMGFYTLWTLKEATAKAAGLSVWDSLRNTEFDLRNGCFALRAPFAATSWNCVHAGIEPGWRLAVAAADLEHLSQLRCWHSDMGGQWEKHTLQQPTLLKHR